MCYDNLNFSADFYAAKMIDGKRRAIFLICPDINNMGDRLLNKQREIFLAAEKAAEARVQQQKEREAKEIADREAERLQKERELSEQEQAARAAAEAELVQKQRLWDEEILRKKGVLLQKSRQSFDVADVEAEKRWLAMCIAMGKIRVAKRKDGTETNVVAIMNTAFSANAVWNISIPREDLEEMNVPLSYDFVDTREEPENLIPQVHANLHMKFNPSHAIRSRFLVFFSNLYPLTC